MSGYSGRKGPNVSQYIADLNTIPSAQEIAFQEQNSFVEDDVLSFMNTDFIDWDLGVPDVPAIPAAEFDPVVENQTRPNTRYKNSAHNDFVNNEFKFPDFTSFQPIPTDPSLTGLSPTQPQSHPQPYPLQHQQIASRTSPLGAASSPHAGDKRKFDASSASVGPEEAARLAAEEDKRRRNTAASARFRVKKKQREQALEKTAKEMTEKVNVLEARVQQLEMENKWLKSLITEKNEGKENMKEMFEKFTKEQAGERSIDERKDGVGTESAAV